MPVASVRSCRGRARRQAVLVMAAAQQEQVSPRILDSGMPQSPALLVHAGGREQLWPAPMPPHAQRQRRVVVTGMGVVSCLGHEVDEFYNNLLQGRSGISRIEVSDPVCS